MKNLLNLKQFANFVEINIVCYPANFWAILYFGLKYKCSNAAV